MGLLSAMREDTIAQNLRRIRNEKGISLSRAADQTGVSKAMLGQIERQESSPTIATLWKISQGFGVPLSFLLQEVTCTESCGAVRFPGSISVRIVFPYDAVLGVETFEITLSPGQFHQSEAHVAGLVEDIFVLSGGMELHVDETERQLSQGQAVRFAADQPHAYRGLDEGAVFLNTHYYRRGAF